jgi:hypothetical protein
MRFFGFSFFLSVVVFVSSVPYGEKFGDYTVIVNVEIENRRDQEMVIEKSFVRSGVFEHRR